MFQRSGLDVLTNRCYDPGFAAGLDYLEPDKFHTLFSVRSTK